MEDTQDLLHGNSPSAACPCSRSHTGIMPGSSEQTAGAALRGRSSEAAAPWPQLRGRSEDGGGRRGGSAWLSGPFVGGSRPREPTCGHVAQPRPGEAPGPARPSVHGPLWNPGSWRPSRILTPQHTAFLGVCVHEDVCGPCCVVTGWLLTNTHPSGCRRRGPSRGHVL